MISPGRQSAMQLVYEAQQKNIERMLDAWDKEIDAAIEAQIAASKKRAKAEAQAAAIEGQLQGLIAQAQAGHIVTIPTGIQVASSAISVSVGDELAALHDVLEDLVDAPPEVRSAAWSMTNGFLPHPSDLAVILFKNELDSAWAQAFGNLGHSLNLIDDRSSAHPQLAAQNGLHRLAELKVHQDLMRNYGGTRLAQAVLQPHLLKGTQAPVSPSAKRGAESFKATVVAAALKAFQS